MKWTPLWYATRAPQIETQYRVYKDPPVVELWVPSVEGSAPPSLPHHHPSPGLHPTHLWKYVYTTARLCTFNCILNRFMTEFWGTCVSIGKGDTNASSKFDASLHINLRQPNFAYGCFYMIWSRKLKEKTKIMMVIKDDMDDQVSGVFHKGLRLVVRRVYCSQDPRTICKSRTVRGSVSQRLPQAANCK